MCIFLFKSEDIFLNIRSITILKFTILWNYMLYMLVFFSLFSCSSYIMTFKFWYFTLIIFMCDSCIWKWRVIFLAHYLNKNSELSVTVWIFLLHDLNQSSDQLSVTLSIFLSISGSIPSRGCHNDYFLIPFRIRFTEQNFFTYDLTIFEREIFYKMY